MNKLTILLIIIIMASFLSCKKNEKNILEKEFELSRNASVNVEIKKLNESLKSAENDSEKANIYSKIATIEIDKGDFASSIKSSQSAIKYQPNQYMSHYLLGKSYINVGRYDDAIGELLTSINLNDKYAPSHFELGNAYYKKRDYKNAIDQYKITASLDTNHYMAYNNLGVLYNIFGKILDSEKAFAMVVKINPEFATAYKNLGIIYDIKLKNKELALYNYKKYLQLKPNCPERKRVKAWIKILGG